MYFKQKDIYEYVQSVDFKSVFLTRTGECVIMEMDLNGSQIIADKWTENRPGPIRVWDVIIEEVIK